MAQEPRRLYPVEPSKHPGQGPLAAIRTAARTHIGFSRKENEDAHAVVETPHFIACAVADGVGSITGGALASRTAIRAFREELLRHDRIDEEILKGCVASANSAVLEKGIVSPEYRGMSTTLVALIFNGANLFIANVGDSRAYRYREGQLAPLTHDHTVVFELVRSGLLTTEQAHNNPVSNLLTRALGTTDGVELDSWCSPDRPQPGDRYLLCSDGLHSLVPDKTIEEILASRSASRAADKLIKEANSRGGTDNVTVVVIDIGSEYGISVGSGDAENENAAEQAAPTSLNRRVVRKDLETRERKQLQMRRQLRFALRGWNGALVSFTLGVLTMAAIWYWAQPARRSMPGSGRGDSTASLAAHPARESEVVDPEDVVARVKVLGVHPPALAGPSLESVEQRYQEIRNDAERRKAIVRDLDDVRQTLDLQTRRLALWHNRYRQLQLTDPSALAESVALTSVEVGERKKEFDAAHGLYLKEAENLVYNPVDANQEAKVAALAEERDQKREALAQAVRGAVDEALSESLQAVLEASLQRDHLQAALAALERGKK